MILGLDISTSITGATVLDDDGNVVFNEAWDTRNKKYATSARKKCGITVPKGQKAKQVVIEYIVDNVPDVLIEYTKHGNPKPYCFDKADSWVVAQAGWLNCQKKENLKF